MRLNNYLVATMDKKILFISHNASRTGAPIVLITLLKWIRKNKPEVKFDLLLLGGGDLEEDFRSICDVYHGWNEYTKTELRLNRYLRVALNPEKWIDLLCQNKYDLIYANTVVSISTAVMLKRRMACPLFVHLHESEVGFACMNIDDKQLASCDKFITVSESVKTVLTSRHINEEKITIVHPVSNHMIKIIEDNPHKTSASYSFRIGLVGYGGWTKGSDLLPSVAKQYKSKYPNDGCVFQWIGNFKPLDCLELQHDLSILGLEDTIILSPKVSDPLCYYLDFDIFLLLSREDSFPMVVLENALLRTPTVLFENASGITDILHPGKEAVTVPYLDVDAVVEAIHDLREDYVLRNNIGAAAQVAVKNMIETERPYENIFKLISGC